MSPHANPGRPRRTKRLRSALKPQFGLLISLSTFCVLLAICAAVTETGLMDPLFLPSPSSVVKALAEQSSDGTLWQDIGVSVYRITVGYLIATAMALPLGVGMGVSAKIRAAAEPLMDFIRLTNRSVSYSFFIRQE